MKYANAREESAQRKKHEASRTTESEKGNEKYPFCSKRTIEWADERGGERENKQPALFAGIFLYFFRFDAFKQLFSLVKNNSSLSLSYFHNFLFISPFPAIFPLSLQTPSALLILILLFPSLRALMWVCVCVRSSREQGKRGY